MNNQRGGNGWGSVMQACVAALLLLGCSKPTLVKGPVFGLVEILQGGVPMNFVVSGKYDTVSECYADIHEKAKHVPPSPGVEARYFCAPVSSFQHVEMLGGTEPI